MSLAERLVQERQARRAAERALAQKQSELAEAHRQLGHRAQALSEEIVETRAEVATVRDENQRVKSDLSAAHHKIAVAERRLWHSVQTITDGFAFFDAAGTLCLANKAYLSIFDGLVDIAPGVAYPTILQVMTDEGIVDTGGLTAGEWQDMMIDRWRMDIPPPVTIRLWNDQYVRLVDRRNAAGDMVSVGQNITHSVLTEAGLTEARAAAETASRAKSAFLANMSHEIRTPMNGVVGMADLLAETGLDEDQRLYVDTIRKSGDALLTIIGDVLDYSKIEADRLDLHPEPFDLERCIHDVMMLLEPLAREKGLTLLVDYDLFMPSRFVGDPGRVRQVLTNLMGNAVKFTDAGHVLVRVTGAPQAGGPSQITITVEDTGIGIPADQLDRIFGEFNQVQAARSRRFGGTGLGLAISHRLIGLMGGEMWVTSGEGSGSCFGLRITLPRTEDARPPRPMLPNGLRRVLVVDDVPTNLTILERQLTQLGLEVSCCANGPSALEAMDAQDFDLVLTDHHMPGMDGLALTQAIRARGSGVPIVMISSNPGHAGRDPARAHLHALLQKPVPRRDLIAMLEGMDQTPRAVPAPNAASVRTGTRQMRVLAAEDNKTNQLVLQKMLAPMNIVLKIAQNGEEAVAAYDSFHPDLIFMDISMPRMDGKDAARAIRAREATLGRRVPILALTANSPDAGDPELAQAGLDAALSKPLRKEVLMNRIAALCPHDAASPLPDAASRA
ncbi:MAG: response regulator [Pseudomonadota bacterium]